MLVATLRWCYCDSQITKFVLLFQKNLNDFSPCCFHSESSLFLWVFVVLLLKLSNLRVKKKTKQEFYESRKQKLWKKKSYLILHLVPPPPLALPHYPSTVPLFLLRLIHRPHWNEAAASWASSHTEPWWRLELTNSHDTICLRGDRRLHQEKVTHLKFYHSYLLWGRL